MIGIYEVPVDRKHRSMGTVLGADDDLQYDCLLSLNHSALAEFLQNWRQLCVPCDKWFLKAQDMLCLEESMAICWKADVFISHIQNGFLDDVSLLCTNITLLALKSTCTNAKKNDLAPDLWASFNNTKRSNIAAGDCVGEMDFCNLLFSF